MSDLFRLDGKTIAVIGAGSGIGAAVALGAARQGARVACLDVVAASSIATAEAIMKAGGAADAATLDIADAAATDAAIAGVHERHGSLDGVVCTPSINVRKQLLNYTEDEFDRVVRLNLKGSFNVVRAAGRVMVAQNSGSIVVLS